MEQGAEYMRQWRAKPSNREAEQKRARELAHLARVENELRKHTEWPLQLGYRAAKDGRAFDRTQSADWQRGFWIGMGGRKHDTDAKPGSRPGQERLQRAGHPRSDRAVAGRDGSSGKGLRP